MSRMLRRLYALAVSGLCLTCLLVCVGTTVLWVWSFDSDGRLGWECRIHEQGTVFEEQCALFRARAFPEFT